MDTANETFGSYVRRRRMELGLSVIDLATEAGITRTYMYAIEKEQQEPSATVKEQIKSALRDEKRSSIQLTFAKFQADVEAFELPIEHLIANGECLRLTSDAVTIAKLNVILSKLYRLSRRFGQAMVSAELARDSFLQAHDTYNMCKALYEIAVIDFEMARYPFALSRLQRIESELKTMGVTSDELLSQVYVHIAMTAACINDTELLARYIEMGELGLNLYPQAKRWRAVAMLDYSNAQSFEKHGNYSAAIEKYEAAQRKFQENNDYDSSARMYLNIAKCYFTAGSVGRAEKIAWELYDRDSQDKHNKARAANLLGEILIKREEYAKVDELSRLVYMDTALGPKDRARAFRLKAIALHAQGDQDGYMTFFDEAIRTVIDEDPIFAADLTVEHFRRQPFKRAKL